MPGLHEPRPALRAPGHGFELRPWSPADVDALVAAWADPEIIRWCAVPDDRTAAHAEAWIRGTADRHAAGDTIDLVVSGLASGAVIGEVGVRRLARPDTARPGSDAWEVGWWVLPAHRGQGLAAAAVGLLAGWAQAELDGAALVARIPDGHAPSEAVAARAGFVCRGVLADGRALWVRGGTAARST